MAYTLGVARSTAPSSASQDNNTVEKLWGEPRTDTGLLNHVDLCAQLGITNLEAGATVAGGRGYYLIARTQTLLLHAALGF